MRVRLVKFQIPKFYLVFLMSIMMIMSVGVNKDSFIMIVTMSVSVVVTMGGRGNVGMVVMVVTMRVVSMVVSVSEIIL